MVTLQNRLLALWARAGPDGLVTIDGAFVAEMHGPAPIQRVLALVVEVIDDTPGDAHVFVVEVTFDADGEQVAHIDGNFSAGSSKPSSLVIMVPLNLRREGTYSIAFRVDGEQLAVLPLSAVFGFV